MGIVRPDGECTHRHVLQFQIFKRTWIHGYNYGLRKCYTDAKRVLSLCFIKLCREQFVLRQKDCFNFVSKYEIDPNGTSVN